MAITKPVVFTSIEDAEVTRNRPVSEEVVRKMIQNCNLLAELAKIGSIRCVALNQPGVPVPSVDQWQFADGSEITNLQSPLTSVDPIHRYTPPFANHYIRGAAAEAVNNTGGSYTVNLSHTHTVGAYCSPRIGEEGNEQRAIEGECHIHTVPNDLNASEPLEMAYQEVAIYLKIN